jgi:signal recognition particle subunit SRP68
MQLVEFPPPIEAVPCKPVLFDLALNHLEYPSLESRIKKKGGGILGWFKR